MVQAFTFECDGLQSVVTPAWRINSTDVIVISDGESADGTTEAAIRLLAINVTMVSENIPPPDYYMKPRRRSSQSPTHLWPSEDALGCQRSEGWSTAPVGALAPGGPLSPRRRPQGSKDPTRPL